jgi:hypothetical protein
MHTQDFTVVLNKFDTRRKRLSSRIRDLCSGGLVATKLIVRASPHFTLKACPLQLDNDSILDELATPLLTNQILPDVTNQLDNLYLNIGDN